MYVHGMSTRIYPRIIDWPDARYTPIPENEFYNSVLTRFYESSAMVDQDPTDSHRLAIMYLVLAMGVLLDLDQQPLTAEATRYYQLGRAALALDSILEHQTIQAVQALVSTRSDVHGRLLIARE